MPTSRFATVLAGLAVTAAAVAVLSPAAGAATACPSGQLCFYQNTNYGGGYFMTNASDINDFKKFEFSNGTNLNDRISSIYNNTGHKIDMFVNSDFVASTGECDIGVDPCYADEQIPAHTGHKTVVFNDKYSSFYYDN